MILPGEILDIRSLENITKPTYSFATMVDNLQYSYEGPEQNEKDWQPHVDTLQYEPELRKVT